jgi:hypothetical protein
MHAPRDVPVGGDALARSLPKLLEVAPRNVAAESRSHLVSTSPANCLIHSFTFSGCRFIGVTYKPNRLPRLGIQ